MSKAKEVKRSGFLLVLAIPSVRIPEIDESRFLRVDRQTPFIKALREHSHYPFGVFTLLEAK